MLFSGGRAAMIHVGESRAFQLRGCRLRPVVDDRPHFYVLTLRAASIDAPSN